ncbi:hypothetical protein HYW30_00610 [Candidatus Azambacteria bacterium]|nr:hypothetical protein [Candidatus Azambacteria bacterium]MBI2587793.1 hypothetical protein [Candidatus Azambacteria bacterium]
MIRIVEVNEKGAATSFWCSALEKTLASASRFGLLGLLIPLACRKGA